MDATPHRDSTTAPVGLDPRAADKEIHTNRTSNINIEIFLPKKIKRLKLKRQNSQSVIGSTAVFNQSKSHQILTQHETGSAYTTIASDHI
jgi:hypothetical protein